MNRTWLVKSDVSYVGSCDQCGQPMLLGDGRTKCLACFSALVNSNKQTTKLSLKKEYLYGKKDTVS